MINFWLFCLLLLLVSCLFLIIPTIRYARKSLSQSSVIVLSEEQRRKENVKIFKERITELERDKSSGSLSDENYQQMLEELEASLLNDVQADNLEQTVPLANANSPITNYVFLGFGLLFLSVFSLWFYHVNGAQDQVDQYYAQNFSSAELETAKDLAKQGDMNALLEQLHSKLKQSPDNMDGWQMLARSAMNTQRFDLAIEAYQELIRIVKQQGENPAPLYGLLAQAKYYQSDGRLTAEIDAILSKAFSLERDELNSLGLLAIDAFTRKRYQEAKDYWLRILAIYPEHPAKASIEAGIQRANAELGVSADTTTQSTSAMSSEPQTEALVNVQVSIDESIKKLVNADDTVFIIARNAQPSAGQANVPLAVSRHKVSDLPLSIRLDDSKAMSPMARLSSAKQVSVIARISRSGQPLPAAGDFEAVSADINPQEQANIELLIQNQLK